MLSVCLVLAGYTVLLHHKLSFAVHLLQKWLTASAAASVSTTYALLQEDKQGFTVTEVTVSNDDQVSCLPDGPTIQKPC